MITELLGLAGSGMLGAAFGTISDALDRKGERERLKLELKLRQEARLNDQSIDYLNNKAGFASSHSYSRAFGMLCFTYCACALICFLWPDVDIHTFNPDDEPKRYTLFWGLLSWQTKTTYVYTISTGGVGYALLHPLAFQIGTVITGINPSKK